MIDELLADTEVVEAVGRLRPDERTEDAVARAAWSVLIEPGDGVAGALIAQLGAADALRFGLAGAGEQATAPPAAENARRALAEARSRWRPRARPRAVLDALRGAGGIGARLLIPGDPDWPAALGDLQEHAPVALWVRGESAGLRSSTRAAIVGARMATGYGQSVTGELAGDLAGGGALIVSGGAYGIDGAAHRAALGVGGATVAFLAGGIDRPYPTGHGQLFDRIRNSGGAVLSEAPCGTTPTKWRFLARNRLIAALGAATVVVEAGRRSGSLNTAGHAASLGRPLGAVPGPVTSPASAGCHRLMREYDARCVTTAAEIRELWGEEGAGDEADARPAPETVRLLDAMSTRTPHPPDELSRRSGLSHERVRAVLGRLELEGTARRRDGGWLAIRSH